MKTIVTVALLWLGGGLAAEDEPPRDKLPAQADDASKPTPTPAERNGDGNRDEAPKRRQPPDDESQIRVREIEEAIWAEIELLEHRIRGIREQLLELTGGSPARPSPAPGPDGPASPADKADEKRYNALLKRQAELLNQWEQWNSKEGERSAKRRDGDSGEAAAEGSATAEKIRSQLREVLAEQLEIRERARERHVKRLRAELEDIERAMKSRKRDEERRDMIELRLRELLHKEPSAKR